jgi:hypothetical protein
MKHIKLILSAALILFVFQSAISQKNLISINPNQETVLSLEGASYFARLSLNCTGRSQPHYYTDYSSPSRQASNKENEIVKKIWPSFYGCYDWHSSVHNHWALIKILKHYPDIPEAKEIRERLNKSFDGSNIKAELKSIQLFDEDSSSLYDVFEFPYGRSWLLKVADELLRWNDTTAQRWYLQLKPLSDYLADRYKTTWLEVTEPVYTGEHHTSSMGISFALDFARTAGDKELENLMKEKAILFYQDKKGFDLSKEPFGYDFMSKGLLVCDLMRKVLQPKEYEKWIKTYVPQLFDISAVDYALQIKETSSHTGFAAHWDGFHLNRIWCLNGIMKSMGDTVNSKIRNKWKTRQLAFWNYAQTSIGKGNYDIDHWLSSFSVFALMGYVD